MRLNKVIKKALNAAMSSSRRRGSKIMIRRRWVPAFAEMTRDIKKMTILTLIFGFFLAGLETIQTHAIGAVSKGVIINNTLAAQINYPIDVTLNTTSEIAAGRMRSDCGDIRVVASDLTTNLTYAFLNCNTVYTSIVALVPSLPLGETTIYITFGDSALTTTQAPATVFDKYEMFTAAPTCTPNGTPVGWDAINSYYVLTNATAANANGECNYTYPAPATTIKGYKAWFDTLETTAAGSTPVGTTSPGQAIWQYAYNSTIPVNEDVTSGGGHFTIDAGNSRKCFTRAVTSGAACVTANGASPNTGAVADATIGDGNWRNFMVSHDPASPATGTKRMMQNGVNILNTTAGTAVTTANTNFGFGGRKTTTRARENRVRRFAVMKYSELITARFLDSATFVIRNSGDTVDFTNSCDFGDLSVGSVGSCQYRLKYTTSSGNGYSIQVQTSGDMISGAEVISNATAGTGGAGGTLITAGTEKYGVSITAGSCTRGTMTTTNTFSPSPGNSVLFNYATPTTVASCSGQNQTGATDLTNTILVDQKIAISGNTPAGIYTQTVTWTAVPSF
jgi:Domain of unknown function (DUF2341)